MTQGDVLTTTQVAQILRVSENTVQRKSWREKTGCPLKKKGKRLYVIAKEFYSWMTKG